MSDIVYTLAGYGPPPFLFPAPMDRLCFGVSVSHGPDPPDCPTQVLLLTAMPPKRKTEGPKNSQLPLSTRRLTDIPKSPHPRSPIHNTTVIIDPIKLVDPNDAEAESADTPQKSHKKNKKHCPCGLSTGGESWLLTCLDCKQVWHNTCAGLKADFTKAVLDSLLKTWQCPWCYNCPYKKPGSHMSLKNSNDVSEKVLIASTVKQITDSISENSSGLSNSLTTLEHRLSSVNSDIDSIRGTQDLISQRVLPIVGIETHLQHQLLSQAALEQKMKTMQASLAKLQDNVAEFSQKQDDPPRITTPIIENISPSAPIHVPHKQEPMHGLTENFVDEDSARSLMDFLNASTFNDENGHSVLSFGTSYKYTGSRSTGQNQAIPQELHPLLDKVNNLQNETFYNQYPDYKKYGRPAPTINSLLINKYEGPNSYLPKHSDNENSIHCESNIFTLSLGAESTIKFSPKTLASENDELDSVTCRHRSLYSMSRKSQEFFEHEIKAGSTGNDTRYSLTFRSISSWNKNSTCIIGDSNTGRLNFGTDKKKTFGELMPGHRFWAPTVDSIDPSVCSSYQNVVLMCGINNIKKVGTINPYELDSIYQLYVSKIKEIRHINPKCKIYVCPILPTKNFELNQCALYFNNLIFTDLVEKDLGVQYVKGFNSFLERDHSGLLAQDLSRELDKQGRQDFLHLNLSGTRMLARYIKQCVFGKFNSNNPSTNSNSNNRFIRSNRVNGRSYSSVTESPSTARGSRVSGT